MAPKVWEARKAAKFVSRNLRKKKTLKGKGAGKVGSTVRSKKKVDVWR